MKKNVWAGFGALGIALAATAALGQGPDGGSGGPLEWNGGKEILEAGDGSFVRNRSEWMLLVERIDVAEDFDSVGEDVPFRARRAEFTSWDIMQVGRTTLLHFRNSVDTPPFEFVDNNGTTHASCWTDFPEVNTTGVSVVLEFGRPLEAWGAEFWGASSGERLDVEFLDSGGATLAVMGATKNSSLENEFLGYVASPGSEIHYVRFKSRYRRLGTGGEGFGMDDMVAKFTDNPTCYADCDTFSGSGTLDIFDFLCFQNRFAAQDPWACDCDTGSGFGICDAFDFLCYQNAFAAGCP